MDIIDYRYIILYYNIIHIHIHITYIYNTAIQAIHNTPQQARLAASHRSPYAGRRPSPCCCQRPGESLRPSPEKRGPWGPAKRQRSKMARKSSGKIHGKIWPNMAKYCQYGAKLTHGQS